MNGQPIINVELYAAALVVDVELYTVEAYPVELLSIGVLAELLVIELFVVEMLAVEGPETLLGSSETSENDS